MNLDSGLVRGWAWYASKTWHGRLRAGPDPLEGVPAPSAVGRVRRVCRVYSAACLGNRFVEDKTLGWVLTTERPCAPEVADGWQVEPAEIRPGFAQGKFRLVSILRAAPTRWGMLRECLFAPQDGGPPPQLGRPASEPSERPRGPDGGPPTAMPRSAPILPVAPAGPAARVGSGRIRSPARADNQDEEAPLPRATPPRISRGTPAMDRHARRALVALALLLAAAPPARAAEFHYALVFGSQSHPKQLRYTHTWATFVRAVGEGPDPANYRLETHTISWLPATLDVRVWTLRPEPGVNLTSEQTLAYVLANGERVTAWGPFLIPPEVHARSLQVKQLLESGRVEYRAISTAADLLVADCIHAVAAVDPIFGRDHYPLIRVGKPASRYLAREIVTRSLRNRGLDQAALDNAWLIPRLGLGAYPIAVVPPAAIPPRRCLLCRCPEPSYPLGTAPPP